MSQAIIRKWIVLPALARQVEAFLVSYPKSGRTWLRFLLANYFSDVFGLGLAVDTQNLFSILPNFDKDPVRGIPSFTARSWPKTVPLIAVSHLPFSRWIFGTGSFVFMVRDPRDVLVSAYFHETRHKGRFSGDMASFLKDKKLGLPALAHYLNVWSNGLERRDHVMISYERLSRAPEQEVEKLLRALRVPIDRTALDRAIRLSRFEAMQEIEIRVGIPGHSYDRTDLESRRMRKGIAHGYNSYLSAEHLEFIDNYCAANLSDAAKRALSLCVG